MLWIGTLGKCWHCSSSGKIADCLFRMTPLHHAILVGSENQEVVLETLVSSFGADVLLP